MGQKSMECLVTGAAGFIGSHLCERLIREGHRVVGLDSFTSYYAREQKQRNLSGLLGHRWFRFEEADLRITHLAPMLRGTEWIFHLAAMPGLVRSWSAFDEYASCNVIGTQRLLEACRSAPMLNRFIFASTSSVYGKFASGDETLPIRPSSPYGITKASGEQLCRVYLEQFDIPTVALRYFSVFGPRQRPDMGYNKFIRAILNDETLELTGDGTQVRGNTYVSDIVEATVAAIHTPVGETYNIGGGESVSIAEVIRRVETICGRPARILELPERPGDQKHSAADSSKFHRQTGWKPKVGITEGLEHQVRWQMQQASTARRAA